MRKLLSIALLVLSAHVTVADSLTDLAEGQHWSELAESLDSGVAPDSEQPDGMTALHWAAHWGHAPSVERLIQKGASVTKGNQYGFTPLALACKVGNHESGQLLLDAGADAKATTSGKETMLMHAARSGNPSLVRSLIDAGAEVNAKQQQGQTALMWAAVRGNSDCVRVLLERGADRDEKLRSGFTAFHFAVRQGHSETVKDLIDAGSDVNQSMNPVNSSGRNPRKGMSPLLLAVESAHFELALRMVDWGADPNDQHSGYAVLHAVSWVRRPPRGDNPAGDPPPMGSGNVGSLQFVRELVARGADVNLPVNRGKHRKAHLNHKGATPFLFAAFTGDLPLARTLRDLGADIRLANADGTTPLLAATGVGIFVADEYPGSEAETLAMVNQLVQWGAQLDDRDDHGETVVHGAAYRSFPRVVDRLCHLGANPKHWYSKNELGSTPLELAKGKRPGSFKPNKATIEAITNQLKRAGISPDDWQRPMDKKTDWSDDA